MTKNTLELSTGDIVVHYGVRLRLTDRREYGAEYYPRNTPDMLPVVAFSTEYAGTINPECDPVANYGQYGRDMVNGRWTIQGNRYAVWSVES